MPISRDKQFIQTNWTNIRIFPPNHPIFLGMHIGYVKRSALFLIVIIAPFARGQSPTLIQSRGFDCGQVSLCCAFIVLRNDIWPSKWRVQTRARHCL